MNYYWEKEEVLSKLESSGLIYTIKFGREVVPYLTDEGKKVLGYINYILAL